MTSTRSPAIATISLGLVFGLLFAPMVRGFGLLLPHPYPTRLTVWLYLYVYGVFLAGWNAASGSRAVFPLFLMGVVQFAAGTQPVFWCLILVTLSWLRSGVFCPGGPLKTLAKEFLVCGGGGLLTTAFHPRTLAEFALAVWLFTLIQALYFVMFPVSSNGVGPGLGTDTFEKARQAAEQILHDGK